MTEDQFWWANLHGRDHDEVVEVTFVDGKPAYVYEAGDSSIPAVEFERCKVRLIESVLPAGRAAAAVEKLQEAFDTGCAEDIWGVVRETLAILQAVEAARL